MISTTEKRPDHLDIEPWFAMSLIDPEPDGSDIFKALFTTKRHLTARLNAGPKAAQIAARQIKAASDYLAQLNQ